MLNLSTLLEDSARRHPDRDAVVLGDVRVDYQTAQRPGQQGREPVGEPRRQAR